jgi:hypothetical protein
MTILEDAVAVDEPSLRLGEAARPQARPPRRKEEPAPAPEPEEDDGAALTSPFLACATALLASAAAGWMAGGVFTGYTARLVGVLAALLGAGMVWVSYRTRIAVVVQFLIMPVAVIAGGILIAPDATGGTANLPSLVVEALKAGGLTSPPIPFDPGWRFLLVILLTSVSVTAASAALATDRPLMAVLIPTPLVVAAMLVQPPSVEVVSAVVSLVLMIGALTVAFGADLASQGATGGQFEVRRFGKAAAMLAGLVAVLVIVSQSGLLYPEQRDTSVIPPRKPETPPPSRDRVIFAVRTSLSLPWRMGVLDVYEDDAWLTPPFDPKRFIDVPAGGRVPGGPAETAPDKRIEVDFTITDLEGRVVPTVAAAIDIANRPDGAQVDPRTQQLRLGGRVRAGTRYTVEAALPPDAKTLLAAAWPNPAMKPFLTVPAPPPEVQDLLAEMPDGLPLYEQLQFVRSKLYESVIAAGAGNPVDVPPARVGAMLGGAEASPYEITAAEVLLARWAGVPARIGYGYFGGEPHEDRVEIHPKHGAMWLEAWFEGSGWVPIVGRPPRAKSSLSQNEKNDQPTIRPTEELGAVVYLPIRLRGLALLYQTVQYWLAKVFPIAAALALAVVFYPGLLKIGRRARRRVWATRGSPRDRVGVAYAELRDAAIDFNFGHPTLTPIEFLDVLDENEEHVNLAWLATRVLWGDLARDVRSEDAQQAELYSRSLRRRLARGQSPLMRILAFASRASLKDPWEPDIPNLWWPWSPRAKASAGLRVAFRAVAAAARAGARRVPRLGGRGRRRPGTSTALLLVVAALAFGGCVRDVDLKQRSTGVPPLPEVPQTLLGYRFEPNQHGVEAFDFYYDVSLAAVGGFYAIRDGAGVVQGTLQTSVIKPALKGRDREVRQAILRSTGGRFKLERIAGRPVFTQRLAEQRMLLAIAPDALSYQLLVSTQGFGQAEELFVNLLAHQQGEGAVRLADFGGGPPLDPRRGP